MKTIVILFALCESWCSYRMKEVLRFADEESCIAAKAQITSENHKFICIPGVIEPR
jgi:hypothetical protein